MSEKAQRVTVLRCPFCGGLPDIPKDYGPDFYRVCCGRADCLAEGPWRKTVKGAIGAWNERKNSR